MIAARIGLLRAFHELWLVGRGRLVDPSVLRAAVSETFATEVIEVAKECGRDARALIEALRAGKVKRFGGKKIDDLELALCEGGFIDRRPPITFEDLVWKARGHSELPSDSIREWCARWWAASQRAFETRRGKSLRADSTIGAVEGSKDG